MSNNDQDQADALLNQLNPESEALDQPEELATAEAAESTPSAVEPQETSDNTAEMPKNQAKGAPAPKLTLRQSIDQRLAVIQNQLSEKEQLQLTYVYSKVPKPYYWRWKSEANEVFSLCVGLKARRRKIG